VAARNNSAAEDGGSYNACLISGLATGVFASQLMLAQPVSSPLLRSCRSADYRATSRVANCKIPPL